MEEDGDDGGGRAGEVNGVVIVVGITDDVAEGVLL